MKKIISHRGNTDGANTAKYGENHPSTLVETVKNGFDIEIDVWLIDNKFYLGHDKPTYKVFKEFLLDRRYWIHCKNIEALYELLSNNVPHLFYHNNDDCTLTSTGYIWSFPRENVVLTNKSVAVLPELVSNWKNLENAYAICTDFPNKY